MPIPSTSIAPLAVALALLVPDGRAAAQDEPARPALATRWASQVRPDAPLPEYPRPQLRRERWLNLNGVWECAIQPRNAGRPAEFVTTIVVPFAAESALSGLTRRVGAENRLWYRRSFGVPEGFRQGRVLLHFGAVDWECRVWLNGRFVGEHRGGYDPFSFDVTDQLADAEQELIVAVWDPTDRGTQPRGKQVEKPRGIWYTPVTGIWQTVWLEPVPELSVQGLRIRPDFASRSVSIGVTTAPAEAGHRIRARARANGRQFALVARPARPTADLRLTVPAAAFRPWSPDDPFLYDLIVEVLDDDGVVVDSVQSYFGIREIAVRAADDGHLRLFLNGAPLYQHGPLDQGWWPDGLYTAPTDAALRYDLEVTKQLGFNMVRKHVKVEPARWYHHCDRLGLLVWQDVPNGDRGAKWTADESAEGREIGRTAQSAWQFEGEATAIVRAFENHPLIVMWVPFNEAWGQFDTVRIAELIERLDPTRLVNCASGGNFFAAGHVLDVHGYPGPRIPRPRAGFASVLGEFGGLGLPLPGHTWQNEKNWGYRSFEDRAALQDAFEARIRALRPMIAEGLAASVYTQTTDVEIEVNGLMTYDRAVIKLDAERVAALQRTLYLPPPKIATVVPTSERERQTWHHRTTAPPGDWQDPTYDDSAWQTAPGGFGTAATPGAVLGTEWSTNDIWLRRSFAVDDASMEHLHLRIHHDEDARVWLNGTLIAELAGYTGGYELVPIETPDALRAGRNVLAVHCRQTGGGQFIDVGIVALLDAGR